MARTLKMSDAAFQKKLRDILTTSLLKAGIRPKVYIERVPGTRLNRVTVVSSAFKRLRPSERQDLIWRIVGSGFGIEDQLRISMIYTFSSDELLQESA